MKNEKAKKTSASQSKISQKRITTKSVTLEKTKSVSKNTTQKQPAAKKSVNSTSKVAKSGSKTRKNPQNLHILGFHDLKLETFLFDDVKDPKAVVIIIHGMQEHCRRYDNFANFLNKNGYIVVASDLRGHGRTAIDGKFGFGEKDIFPETVQDQLQIIYFAAKKYGLPIFVFGHSYGSMLSQKLVQCCPLIEKCVLCGTTNGDSFIMKLGNGVLKALSLVKEDSSPGGILEDLCIKAYGKKFERGNWFSRDEKVFDEYLQDKFCGGSFPFGFYKSLIYNMSKMNAGIPQISNTKLFLIAGENDPVGEEGEQVKKLHQKYLENNVAAKIKLYPGARHELINEINKKEVYQDVLNFFDS